MKSTQLTTLLLFLFSISLFSQSSVIVKVTHKPGKTLQNNVSVYDIPDWMPISSTSPNCFPFLSFKVFVKAKSKDKLMYKVEVTNAAAYNLELDCSRWGLGNGGRRTIKANSSDQGNGGSFSPSEDFPTIEFSNLTFNFPKAVQEKYGVSSNSDYIQCGETAASYLNKKEKAIEPQQEDSNLGANEVTEDAGYQVLDVDTSAYEASKEQKRQQAEQNATQQAEQATTLDRQEQLKAKQLADAQNFIANQNEASARYDAALENLGNTLNTQFTEMSNSWAREQEYMNQISSLSQIRSTSVSGIIDEARRKQEQIETVFDRKAKDLESELATARVRTLAAAKNETQAAVGELLAATATVIAQRKLEKDEREARQNLERQKESELSKIAEKLKEKYRPIKKEALKAATLAVTEAEEVYYLEQYAFANCMIEDADDIIRGSNYCDDPGQKNFTRTSKKQTGASYYNAFERKAASSYEELQQKAPYFLELALQKEPNNAVWLYEKSQLNGIQLIDKLAILKKVTALDAKNSDYSAAYTEALNDYKDVLDQKRIHEEQKAKYGSDIIKNTLINLVHNNYNWEHHENLKMISIKEYKETFFMNQKGETVLDASNYDSATDFFEGLALVSKDGLFGYINAQGEVAIPLQYSSAGVFNGGKATVADPKIGLVGYINKKGETVIPFQYIEASNFSEGLAFVTKLKDGKSRIQNYVPPSDKESYYIDEQGNEKFSGRFDSGTPFTNGSAVVVKYKSGSLLGGGNNKYRYIDKTGEYLFNEGFHRAEAFNKKGYAIVANEKMARGNRYFMIDKKGKKQHDGNFEESPRFVNGLAVVNIGGIIKEDFVLLDDTGTILTKKSYRSIGAFADGKARAVEKNGKGYFIDEKGNPIEEDEEVLLEKKEAISAAHSPEELKKALMQTYDQVLDTEGGFWVSKDKLMGYINYEGEVVIPVTYWQLGQFNDGLAYFCPAFNGGFGTKYGYMNTKGEIVIKQKYQEASNFSEGLAVVGKVSLLGRKVGYINTEGKEVISLRYYTATPFKNGQATVNNGSYYKPDNFVIDKNGDKVE